MVESNPGRAPFISPSSRITERGLKPNLQVVAQEVQGGSLPQGKEAQEGYKKVMDTLPSATAPRTQGRR